MSHLSETINKHLYERVQKSELRNIDLVSIIDLCGSFLNAKTVSDYANIEKISYNGALLRIKTGKVKTFELFNTQFIIDNI